jgi:small basic protein (TIGR04137 family)
MFTHTHQLKIGNDFNARRIRFGKVNSLLREKDDLICSCARFYILTKNQFMSQHRSLRAASTLGGKRNVLKRFERTALLEKRGQRKPGDKITGLRKTKPEA